MFELQRDLNSLPLTWWGRCVYFFMSSKRSIAKQNIERVFKSSLSNREKDRLCVAYYSHMLTCLKEIILYAFVSKKYLARHIKISGLDYLENAINKGKGTLIVTGHFGNWEFSPLFFFDKLDKRNTVFYCIRKKLRFKFLDKIFLGRFERCGFKIIHDKNAVSQIRSVLKSNAVVFFPFDVRPPYKVKKEVSTDFLGQKTATNTSLAYLANLCKSSVISMAFYRINKKQHMLCFYPELNWLENSDYKQSLIQNTQLYNNRLEEMLQPYPEQWLWSYNRWKYH